MMKMNAGAWIGIVGGIIGLLIGVGAVVLTGDKEGLYIAGGMLLVFGGMFYLFYRLFFKPMLNMSRLQKHGLPGKARILEVRDTGVTINNSPQVKLLLEVKDDLGQKYNTDTRVLVSRLNPQAYQPGMEIAVKIDPKNKLNVVPDLSGKSTVRNSSRNEYSISEVSSDTYSMAELEKLQQANDAISISGKRAKAIIRSSSFLGLNVNGKNPLIKVEVVVLPENSPSFNGTAKGVVSESSIDKFQPGKEIYVKYDLYDNSRIVIEASA